MGVKVMYPDAHNTNETLEDTQELLAALMDELDMPDYIPPPHTEQQLELVL